MLIKNGSTMFLKTIVSLIGLLVLVFCLFVLPRGINSENTGMYRPILIGMYLPAIPFFLAVYQILKLLHYIEADKVFTLSAVKSLKVIKYCGLIISSCYFFGLPYIFLVAERDDAPGVVLLGLIFMLVPLVVGVLSAILEKLLIEAIHIKSENDNTV